MSLSMDRLWSSHAYSYSCFWTIVYCHGFLLVSVVLGKWRVTFVLPRLVFLGFTWWWIVDPFICNHLCCRTVCCPLSWLFILSVHDGLRLELFALIAVAFPHWRLLEPRIYCCWVKSSPSFQSLDFKGLPFRFHFQTIRVWPDSYCCCGCGCFAPVIPVVVVVVLALPHLSVWRAKVPFSSCEKAFHTSVIWGECTNCKMKQSWAWWSRGRMFCFSSLFHHFGLIVLMAFVAALRTIYSSSTFWSYDFCCR